MKVLVCGGRTYSNYPRVTEVLNIINPDHIVHGAAKGADSLGGRYAKEHSLPCSPYPAQWEKVDPRTGRTYTDRGAGTERNKRMLLHSKPDLVVAFPGGPGTRHMTNFARTHGYRVIQIPDQGPLPKLPSRPKVDTVQPAGSN